MNNQKGFTLIELIVVIVILGILSAVAVPKFLDMSGDAEKATVEAARGAMKSAAAILHAKSLVANAPDATITVENVDITMVNGYPAAVAAGTDDGGIALAAGIDASDYTIDTTTTAGECTISKGAWKVTYTQAASGGVASVGTVVAN